MSKLLSIEECTDCKYHCSGNSKLFRCCSTGREFDDEFDKFPIWCPLEDTALVKAVTKMNLKPGDHLVVNFKDDISLTDDDWTRLREGLEKQFPDNKILILQGDIELSIRRRTYKGREIA
jgi:hypothetical protein